MSHSSSSETYTGERLKLSQSHEWDSGKNPEQFFDFQTQLESAIATLAAGPELLDWTFEKLDRCTNEDTLVSREIREDSDFDEAPPPETFHRSSPFIARSTEDGEAEEIESRVIDASSLGASSAKPSKPIRDPVKFSDGSYSSLKKASKPYHELSIEARKLDRYLFELARHQLLAYLNSILQILSL